MCGIEATDMVDDPHPSHLGSNSFEHPGRWAILIAYRCQGKQKLVRGVFQFDKYSQKDSLMISVTGKEDPG